MTATSGTEESGHCTHSVGGAGRGERRFNAHSYAESPAGYSNKRKNGKRAVHAHFPFLFHSPPSLGRKETSLEESGSNVIFGKGKNNNIQFYFCGGYVTKIKMCSVTL